METSNNAARDVESLRLPELQRRYAEVIGEATRCPNRVYLIRRINEALATRSPAVHAAGVSPDASLTPSEPTAPSLPTVPTADATTSESPSVAAGVTSGQPQASPGYLAVVNQRGRLKSMSVEELQAKYREIVGRSTGSVNPAYLIWKIREAAKGRVPIGPRVREERASELGEMKTLPLRIGSRQLEELDDAWRTRGVKNRMEFFRLAVGHYLGHIGAAEAAALFESAG